ncbi:MAG: hypothetical protein AAGF12_34850 [Myxococcota bacterium]
MGVAWFDDEPPEMPEIELRTGGLPLLPEGVAWPTCARCELPMLFRAQVPLNITPIASYDDPRVLLIFECYASGDTACDSGQAVVVSGGLEPRPAPPPSAFDLMLHDRGPNPSAVDALVFAIADCPASTLPSVIMQNAPSSIVSEAVRAIEEAGGRAEALPSAATVLPWVRGGRLVPFDDGIPGLSKTTLPPLAELRTGGVPASMRGILGGSAPGYRDYAVSCRCGEPTRTALRLLADRSMEGPALRPATIQVCRKCGATRMLRT